MALFGGKETKEDKVARKAQAMMEKYGLDDLEGKNLESARAISNALMGNSLIELGNIFTGSGVDTAKMSFLRAIVELFTGHLGAQLVRLHLRFTSIRFPIIGMAFASILPLVPHFVNPILGFRRKFF